MSCVRISRCPTFSLAATATLIDRRYRHQIPSGVQLVSDGEEIVIHSTQYQDRCWHMLYDRHYQDNNNKTRLMPHQGMARMRFQSASQTTIGEVMPPSCYRSMRMGASCLSSWSFFIVVPTLNLAQQQQQQLPMEYGCVLVCYKLDIIQKH